MATIDSKAKWNPTGINLVKGRKYSYEATGRWRDWYIDCDADGYSNPLMNLVGWMKRVPTARWFQLVGAVNQSPAHFITLGKSGTFIAPATGILWAFSNDAPFAYGNNSGFVELHIEDDT